MSSATSINKVLPAKAGSYRNQKQAAYRNQKQAAYRNQEQAAGQGERRDPSRGFRVQPQDEEDGGFRPWHFFVLASLMAATAAVILARRSTPEHLVLISLTIGAAGLAAAAFYRMLAPLAADDVTLFSEPLSERQRAELEREKALVLRSIKELEFDRAMGKVSPNDFDEMSGRLRARALSLIKELDAGGSGYREIIERELNARISSARVKTEEEVVRLKPDATANGSVRLQADPTRLQADPTRLQADAVADLADKTCACGAANDADAAFCKRCGARLS